MSKVVLTFGIFDLLHTGHLNLLERAKQEGDILIVGVGSDYSVNREPKKKWKTIISSEDRLRLVNSLKCVDWAFVYGTYDDLEKSIEIIKPDLYVRGDDWSKDFPGKKTLDRLKISIKLLPYTQGVSSTDIKNKIRKVEHD